MREFVIPFIILLFLVFVLALVVVELNSWTSFWMIA